VKRTALARRTPLLNRTTLTSASPLRHTPLAAVSRKRAGQNRTYTTLRARFLADHVRCEFPLGCPRPAEVVHHARGRRGKRLLDTTWWRAACVFHNDFAEDHTGEALACGWLVRIEAKA
jgi:hypothetical protein